MIENILSDELLDEWQIGEDGKQKKVKGSKSSEYDTGKEPKYPLVAQYDERHEAIVILCSNTIDTTFIKNALGIGKEMSYKSKQVKETSVVTAKKFIEVWMASKSK